MKTEEEILKEGRFLGDNTFGTGYFAVICDGNIYPFRKTRAVGGEKPSVKMLNPLDPVVLLSCLDRTNPECLDMALEICETLMEVSSIRRKGYTIATRYKSGAPRAIIEKDTNNVIILGDRAKRMCIMLPILSTQLADDSYDQANISVWKERGFKTPLKYSIEHSHGEYAVEEGEWQSTRNVDRTVDSYRIGNISVCFVHVEGETTDVTEDEDAGDGRKWFQENYFYVDEVHEEESVPSKTERPYYIWQDKGAKDED